VEDTTTEDFDGGTWSTDTNSAPCINFNTAGDQMTGTTACYDATGICGNFMVLPTDRSGTANWATAMSYCDNLCPTCDLPTRTELQCICSNKDSIGTNFVAAIYWSATEDNSTNALKVKISGCASYSDNMSLALPVRCVRR
jgi:hypothetical protein